MSRTWVSVALNKSQQCQLIGTAIDSCERSGHENVEVNNSVDQLSQSSCSGVVQALCGTYSNLSLKPRGGKKRVTYMVTGVIKDGPKLN